MQLRAAASLRALSCLVWFAGASATAQAVQNRDGAAALTDTRLPKLEIVGKPEQVASFAAGTGCSQNKASDLPDTRVYAFRRDDGKVLLFSSNSRNYASVGGTVETATRGSCETTFVTPDFSPDPGQYHGKMWLKAAVEAPNGDILGFIHEEYHGELYDDNNCQGRKEGKLNCWYASTLLAISKDGGKSFELAPGKTFQLAVLPFKYSPGLGRVGYASPYPLSHREGDSTNYMYVFVHAVAGPNAKEATSTTGKQGTCLMRGTDAEPANWRMWGGSDFDVSIAHPYSDKVDDPSRHLCTPVLSMMVGAVKYVPARQLYVAIGTRGDQVLYTFSKDLVHWSKSAALTTFAQKQLWSEGMPAVQSYYSLLDPTSDTRSFETLAARPFLYYVESSNPTGPGKAKGEQRLMRVLLNIK